ncbi:MAG: protein-glutamate O-methyltransferase [Amphritea sp.]|nr:protein-glutamate O-methyltransferase [Amphritea sp.]
MTVMNRQYTLADSDFEFFQRLITVQTGIVINETKKELVYSRLSKRIRALGLSGFSEYIDLLRNVDSKDELVAVINAITTNLTAFFREEHHFEYIEQTLLPELIRKNRNSKKIRIWSAGCSTGEEPYSLAMVLAENLGADWDWKILATDIDTDVLNTARSRIYSAERITGISAERQKRWLKKGTGPNSGLVQIKKELGEHISFNPLNLMDRPWPMSGKFDFIFCRNVIIYFDMPTKTKLVERYADQLVDDGHLFIGHSESLFQVTDRYDSVGNTIYRKR